MEKSFITGVISLVKSCLTDEKVVLPDDFDYEKAFVLAKSHRVVPLLYYGIIKSGITVDAKLLEKYFTLTCQSISVSEKQKFELARMTKEFEENGIDHMILKGSVIRSLYPKQEMRSMGDADVLIHSEQYDKIVPILEKNGMKFVKENLNELCWDKYPFYLELHRYLVSPKHKDYYKYFGDGWKFAKLSDGCNHTYQMTDEDFFVFLFAHLTKHYRSAGVGIKHVTDIWVYLKEKPQLNMEYIKQELDKLKMSVFFENMLKTIDVWFGNADFDEVTYLITQKIFKSGAFGTAEDTQSSEALRVMKSSKVKNVRVNRIITSVFYPYSGMCKLFPVLKKAPILLPFFWVYRLIVAILFKRSKIVSQYKTINSIDDNKISKFQEELLLVGLDYNFEE